MINRRRDSREASVVGLYGKAPAFGDFIRIGASGAAVGVLDRWLQAGLRRVAPERWSGDDEPVLFLFNAPRIDRVLIGMWRMSRDRVGRRFPLVVFDGIPRTRLRGRVAAFPLAYARFFVQARELIDDAVDGRETELRAALQELCPPDAERWSRASKVVRALMNQVGADDLRERLFDANADRSAYALAAVRRAFEAHRHAGERRGLALDCPLGQETDLLFWLSLAERLQHDRGPGVISAIWRCKTPRLLLGLGQPLVELYQSVADSTYRGARLWTLKVEDGGLVERTVKALPTAQRQAAARSDISLSTLLTAFAC